MKDRQRERKKIYKQGNREKNHSSKMQITTLHEINCIWRLRQEKLDSKCGESKNYNIQKRKREGELNRKNDGN